MVIEFAIKTKPLMAFVQPVSVRKLRMETGYLYFIREIYYIND